MNRASWDLTRDAFKSPPSPDDDDEERVRRGPEVVPGMYIITMKFRGNEARQSVHVLPDPRQEVTVADRLAKWNAILRAGQLQESVTDAIMRIQKTRTDIDAVTTKVKKSDADSSKPDPITASAKALKQKLDAMERRLWNPPPSKGLEPPTAVMSYVGRALLQALQSSFDAPTEAQMAWLARAEAAYRAVLPDYNKLFAEDVATFREAVRKQNVELLPEYKPVEWK